MFSLYFYSYTILSYSLSLSRLQGFKAQGRLEGGRSVTLTIHRHLGREWIQAIPPLPPSASVACAGTASALASLNIRAVLTISFFLQKRKRGIPWSVQQLLLHSCLLGLSNLQARCIPIYYTER
jgi:hypothetical protein